MDSAPAEIGWNGLGPVGGDPHEPAAAWKIILRAVFLILLGTVVAIQRPAAAPPDATAKAAAGLSETMGPSIEVSLFSKIYFCMKPFAGMDPSFSGSMQSNIDALGGFESEGDPATTLGPPVKPQPAHVRIQAAILAAETLGTDAALRRVAMVEDALDPESPLVGDIALLRRIYGGEPAADVGASLSDADREAFIERHGMFGRLALTFGDEQAPVRTDAASRGMILLLVMMLFGGAAMLAGCVGFALLIYFGVQLGMGKLRRRFVAPTTLAAGDVGPTSWGWSMDPQGRLIWLETVAVFLLGFLVLGLSGDVLSGAFPGQAWVAYYSLLGQWALLLTLFWPVARGMPWSRWRSELGWHRGTGVANELGAGLMCYLASLPIYFATAFVVAIAIFIASRYGWELAPAPADNKLLDLAMSGNPLLIMLIFLLATLWAPIVEESIFRGALYRHTRWRSGPLVAGLLTAFVFAIMHGYAVIQLLMVGLLGVVFAIMREWRGSLIGPMIAHFTHNAIVLTFVILLFGQLGR